MRYSSTCSFFGLLCAGSVPFGGNLAMAQTQVWSETERTEVWSETQPPPAREKKAEAVKPPAATEPKKTEVWSTPTTTKVEKLETKTVKTGNKVDPRLVGTWDVRIPTTVSYSSDGRRVYRHVEPGADFNRLTIRADGSYQWGSAKSTLKEVRPWFADEGQRYFEIAKDKKNKYFIRFNEADRTLAMFFDVGGFVAKGTRVRSAGAKTAKAQSSQSKARSNSKPSRKR
jgi:hypothetical protein